MQADEVELDDDDLMVVEDAPARPSLAGVGVRTVMTAREAPSSRLPAVRPPPVSSRSMVRAAAPSSRPRSNPIDVRVEDEVIDECISSIEAAVAASSPGPMRAAHPRFVDDQAVTTRDPQLPSSAHRSARALPPPSTPPAFVRRSQPMGWAPRAAVPASQSHPSVAPVALSNASNEPTVIVVKQRPKSAFVLASAAIGALAAIVAMRLTGVDAHPAPATAPAAQPPVAAALTAAPTPPAPALAASTAASAPASPTAAGTPAPTADTASEPTVVTFKDDQGVAIQVPASTSAAAPSRAVAPGPKPQARPKAPTSGPPPLLPDTPAGRPAGVSKVANGAPVPAPKSEAPARRRPLSAAERLAEEQLRAALK
ncbi:MAG: hypothetical protein R3B36_06520 [Polyangiaceae bacterium]